MQNPFSRVVIQHNMNVILCEGTLIMWDLEDRFNEPGPYKFRVYRGRNIDDDFYPITDWIENDCKAYDTTRVLADGLNIDIWYKVKLVDGKNRAYFSNPTHAKSYWNWDDWAVMKEIVRKELLLYVKYSGMYGVLLKQKVWGEPCSCVDPNTEEVQNPDCPLCYGMGIVGGYYAPMRYWCMKEADKRMQKVDPDRGAIHAVISTGRGLACPLVEKNDVIVNQLSDERWHVDGDVQVVADKRGIPVIVNFVIKRIPLSDPVYQIDVSNVPIFGVG